MGRAGAGVGAGAGGSAPQGKWCGSRRSSLTNCYMLDGEGVHVLDGMDDCASDAYAPMSGELPADADACADNVVPIPGSPMAGP